MLKYVAEKTRPSWFLLQSAHTFLMSGLIYTALVRILFLFLVGIVNWEGRGLMIEEENLDVMLFLNGVALTLTQY